MVEQLREEEIVLVHNHRCSRPRSRSRDLAFGRKRGLRRSIHFLVAITWSRFLFRVSLLSARWAVAVLSRAFISKFTKRSTPAAIRYFLQGTPDSAARVVYRGDRPRAPTALFQHVSPTCPLRGALFAWHVTLIVAALILPTANRLQRFNNALKNFIFSDIFVYCPAKSTNGNAVTAPFTFCLTLVEVLFELDTSLFRLRLRAVSFRHGMRWRWRVRSNVILTNVLQALRTEAESELSGKHVFWCYSTRQSAFPPFSKSLLDKWSMVNENLVTLQTPDVIDVACV